MSFQKNAAISIIKAESLRIIIKFVSRDQIQRFSFLDVSDKSEKFIPPSVYEAVRYHMELRSKSLTRSESVFL